MPSAWPRSIRGIQWELISLWLLPAQMGKGIGQALLRLACLLARVRSQLRLRTDAA